MNYTPYISFIHTHSKGICRCKDSIVGVEEPLLDALFLLSLKSCMVKEDLPRAQRASQLHGTALGLLTGGTEDYSRPGQGIRVLRVQKAAQIVHFTQALDYMIADIRPVRIGPDNVQGQLSPGLILVTAFCFRPARFVCWSRDGVSEEGLQIRLYFLRGGSGKGTYHVRPAGLNNFGDPQKGLSELYSPSGNSVGLIKHYM